MLTREEALAAIEEHGSQRRAAEALGVPRSTFRDALTRLSAEPPVYGGYEAERVSTMVRNEQGRPEWVKMQKRRGFTPEELEEAFANIRIPSAEPVPPKHEDYGSRLSLIGIGDAHVSQLSWHRECGENWDTKMSVDMHTSAFNHLMLEGYEGGEECLIAFMGDNLHANNNDAQTPRSKHSLDVDSRIGKVGWEFIQMADSMIQRALAGYRRVTFLMLAGNHDPEASQLLNMAFRLRYRDEERVTVLHNSAALVKYRFSNNLFGFLHGHTMKPSDAPMVMANDWYEEWGQCRYKYVFAGHYHHARRGKTRVIRDDLEAVNEGTHIEIFPVLTAKDAYAAGSKYRSQRAMTRIDFNPEHGEVCRFLVKPEML